MRLKKWNAFLCICTSAVLAVSTAAYANQITITPLDQGQAVSASQIQKPDIASEGAVLLDGASGNVLFAKNGDTQFYPASITKLMTALLVAEHCSLDENVAFSASATTNLESGAVSINMTAGDVMSVKDCLYALLLKSANEVGNALAEHVAGSNSAFADMMNAKAAALGCTNTHFANPHGLNDPEHYTSPHDMALIARAAFQNETVKTVASTRTYTLPATINNPGGLTVTIGHKMLNPGDSRYYEGIIGGKTGYTSKAGNTLVTAAERDGVRLIAVIMKSKSTHYTDTKALLDYGFELARSGAVTAGSQTQTGSGMNAGPGGESSVSQISAGAQTPASGSSQPAAAPGDGDSSQPAVSPLIGTAPDSTSSGATGGPGEAGATGWIQDDRGWYYVKENHTRAASQWLTIDGLTYWFDSDTYMAKGWRQVDGRWYYLRSNGSMAQNYWCQVKETGKWYYLGEDGIMLTSTTTPDGYVVGMDGAWVE